MGAQFEGTFGIPVVVVEAVGAPRMDCLADIDCLSIGDKFYRHHFVLLHCKSSLGTPGQLDSVAFDLLVFC